MNTTIHAKHLQGAGGWTHGQTVTLSGARIGPILPGAHGDLSCEYLTLGTLDIHHHGAIGFDAVSGDWDKAAAWLSFLAQRGVAGIFYTIGTANPDTTRAAMAFARRLMDAQAAGQLPGARIRGIHLEGPYINPEKAGAMNRACIQAPSAAAYQSLTEGYQDIVRLITLAPEMEGATQAAQAIQAHGGHAQAGHTDADGDQARAGFAAGIDGVTHTFNAIRPIHQREGGILAAAMLDDGVYCEAICDGVHVDPHLLALLLRAKGPGRVCMVSDSVPSAGLPDGRYFYSNHAVVVKDGRNYTESGGIAGSAKQQSDGIRNMIAWGHNSHDVLRMATSTPLARFGLDSVLRTGAEATLTGWDAQFNPLFTIIEGVRIC